MESESKDAAGHGPRAWRRLSSEVAGDYGFFRVRKDRLESPRNGRQEDYYILDIPDWVAVVAVTDDDHVVMVEQIRHGTGEPTLEFPSGIIDPGEDPVKAGERELEEETGCRGGKSRLLAVFRPNPAMQSNRMHVVQVAAATRVGEPRQDDGEDVHLRMIPAAEIPKLIAKGKIDHAMAVMTWYYFEKRGAMEWG